MTSKINLDKKSVEFSSTLTGHVECGHLDRVNTDPNNLKSLGRPGKHHFTAYVYRGKFEINACQSVRNRLKSPQASCFHFSLARRTGVITVSGNFRKGENLV